MGDLEAVKTFMGRWFLAWLWTTILLFSLVIILYSDVDESLWPVLWMMLPGGA